MLCRHDVQRLSQQLCARQNAPGERFSSNPTLPVTGDHHRDDCSQTFEIVLMFAQVVL